jgi:transposase InsO family protein
VISGAPKEVILAAKHLRCSICDEKKRPKSRRPASLPTPKDVSDQVHLDIFEATDIKENRFYIIHAIDWTSRFQMAEALTHKNSAAVVKWFQERWLPIFGAPRVLVADQGREFLSWEFQEMCDRHSILLHHIPVQARGPMVSVREEEAL